jgi:hypothetical protein
MMSKKSIIHTDILWHVDPLLGNDRETNNYTTAVTRRQGLRWAVKRVGGWCEMAAGLEVSCETVAGQLRT